MTAPGDTLPRKQAIRLVILLGLVSLFADMTYEGARSITGPFLASLGASATVVGIVAGSGELVGYSLRLASGLLADQTRRYWLITILGYALNLFVIPLLALAGHWETAAVLMVLERVGKGLRSPAKDAILSHATHVVGTGWGFGLHEAMDQIGAMLGPLIVSAVLFIKGDHTAGYQSSFAILLIPALITMAVLGISVIMYPHPQQLEVKRQTPHVEAFPKAFWIYTAAMMLVAAGFADFPLMAYHFEKTALVAPHWIPTLYILAMGSDAVAALVLGRFFDQKGILVMIPATLIAACFAPLAFLGGGHFAILAAAAGMICWGIGMGAQESVARAAIAKMTESRHRASAYGLYNIAYGLSWFVGSVAMGLLYDHAVIILVAFSVFSQCLSLPLLFKAARMQRPES